MISERSVAEEFDGFWGSTLPLLTSSFVRVFNEASVEYLGGGTHFGMSEQPLSDHIKKHDLVAEFSFQLAKMVNEYSTNVNQVRSDKKKLELAFSRALDFLKKYEIKSYEELLNEHEVNDALNLAEQYEFFFDYLDASDIQFSPRIAGAGFMQDCLADLSVDSTLYEIKTVSRNISGKDIKQLLLYLALQYSTGENKWVYAGFYNPRKALNYRFSVEHIIERTSGGRPSSDVFMEIIDFLATRGIELDSSF